jgi:hypothetical protein
MVDAADACLGCEVQFLVFDGGLKGGEFGTYEVGGLHSCFNGWNRYKHADPAEGVILKSLSEIATTLGLHFQLCDRDQRFVERGVGVVDCSPDALLAMCFNAVGGRPSTNRFCGKMRKRLRG